jgi:predicted phosphodiesterase
MRQVQFDYVSDLHIDLTFGSKQGTTLCDLFSTAESQYLLIAGDIGHDLQQNINTLQSIKQQYGYKEIILVLGNHDRYLHKTSREIYGVNKKDISTLEYERAGFIVLDGTSVDIEGVIVGGADGWYDGKYQGYDADNEVKEGFWKSCLNDYPYKACDSFLETFEEEIKKVAALYNKCDIMMTHVRPTINPTHVNIKFRNYESSMFFGFDYEEDLQRDSKLQVWVFGHVHDPAEIVLGNKKLGKRLLCNPFGYTSENDGRRVKQFSVMVEDK